MKIKDKVSGEVYEAETWKSWNGVAQYMKKGTNGPIRSSDDVEIIEEEKPKDTTDWESFRREAAKDILKTLISEAARRTYVSETIVKGLWCTKAVEWADELIKELKRK